MEKGERQRKTQGAGLSVRVFLKATDMEMERRKAQEAGLNFVQNTGLPHHVDEPMNEL